MTQPSNENLSPENQQQRWVKYGANVVLVSVIVILLAGVVIYLAQRKPVRFDTTTGGLYSLKPQTLNVIKNNKDKITIISLYTKAKPGEADPTAAADESDAAQKPVDQAGVVADMLEEYRTRGTNIETESIDPLVNTSKVESLIEEITQQYGGEIKKYKAFADALPAKYAAIKSLADPEAAKIQPLMKDVQEDDAGQAMMLALVSVREVPEKLKQSEEAYQKALKQKPPNYKGITDSVSDNMQGVSSLLGRVIDDFGKLKESKDVSPAARSYMADSIPKYTQIKKLADDLLAEQKTLGELKLDTLRDALKQKNSILVRGKTEWRILPYDKVWHTDARDARRGADAPRARFAGEQMITTAILALNQPTKTKVCFVRAGGPPITEFGGRLNSVADRLRDYNFDVSEKDLSGMYAMQAMQQQQQPAPEPSDTDIEDSVWIVDGVPAQQNPMMGGGPPPGIAGKVADHLNKGKHWVDGKKVDGGSAFLLFIPHGDAMAEVLTPWGITARTDAIAVHKLIKTEGAAQADIINSAQRTPFIFTFNQWGDHMITSTLASLEGILLQAAPIQVTPKQGITSTALIPVPGAPSSPESWGETDAASIETGPKFDSASDIAAPVYVAAAAEKASGQRIVCMGSEPSFIGSTGDMGNNIVDFPDQELLEKKRIYAPAFPGDGEFFMNSVFWLTHQEPMISISPAAMTVSRIRDISGPMQKFWQVGVLLIGLPGLVLVLGGLAYYSRRD